MCRLSRVTWRRVVPNNPSDRLMTMNDLISALTTHVFTIGGKDITWLSLFFAIAFISLTW